jgi:NAD+ diphosphatase
MIGCFAEATTAHITVDTHELEAARWFSREELRQMLSRSALTSPPSPLPDKRTPYRLPPPLGIAHHLVRVWLDTTTPKA